MKFQETAVIRLFPGQVAHVAPRALATFPEVVLQVLPCDAPLDLIRMILRVGIPVNYHNFVVLKIRISGRLSERSGVPIFGRNISSVKVCGATDFLSGSLRCD